MFLSTALCLYIYIARIAVACTDIVNDLYAYNTGAQVLTTGFANSIIGIIWLDQVACAGNEARLIDCPANPIGLHDCFSIEEVGVRCRVLAGKPIS